MYLPAKRASAGDVVITRLKRSPVAYGLGILPGTHQIVYPSLEQAVDVARSFAASERVDVWLRENERDLTRLTRNRANVGEIGDHEGGGMHERPSDRSAG